MGNTCCNYQPKDPNALNFNAKAPEKLTPELEALYQHAKENEEKIVKIQAGFRGLKARKENKVGANKAGNNSSRRSGDRPPHFRLLPEMPEN